MNEEMRKRLEFSSLAGAQEVIDLIKEDLEKLQSDLFCGPKIDDDELREYVGGIRYGALLLKKIDPTYEFTDNFIRKALTDVQPEEQLHEIPREVEIDDERVRRMLPGMKPQAF